MDTQSSLFSPPEQAPKPVPQSGARATTTTQAPKPANTQAETKTEAKTESETSRNDEIQAIVAQAVKESGTRSELTEAICRLIEERNILSPPLPEPTPNEPGVHLLARALDPSAFGPDKPSIKQYRGRVLRRAAELTYLLRSSGWTPPEEINLKPITRDGVTSYPLCTLADIARIVPPEQVNQCLTDIENALGVARDMAGFGADGKPAVPAYFVWNDKGEERVRICLHTAFGASNLRVSAPSEGNDGAPEEEESDDPGGPVPT